MRAITHAVQNAYDIQADGYIIEIAMMEHTPKIANWPQISKKKINPFILPADRACMLVREILEWKFQIQYVYETLPI
jgi:hypothetical protein